MVDVGSSFSSFAYFTEIFDIVGIDSKFHLTPTKFWSLTYFICNPETKFPCLFFESSDKACP
jgi:hypothetical protein